MNRLLILALVLLAGAPATTALGAGRADRVAQIVAKQRKALAPKRDGGQLWAPWRAVEMVERDGTGRNGNGILKDSPTPGRPPGDFNHAFATLSPHLRDFINFGSDSLTPYEMTRLAVGLGHGGQLHVEAREAQSPWRRGDRVVFSLRRPDGSKVKSQGLITTNGGILSAEGGRYEVYYPEYHDGTQGRAKVKPVKLVAPALEDGRLEAWIGK